MGVLRGAERALRDTRIHFVILEYHPAMLATSGTDHEGILHFLAHYGFLCYSLKTNRDFGAMKAVSFEEFADRYRKSDRLKLQGMGAIEDLICENRWWRK
jgi:hypothetical protein